MVERPANRAYYDDFSLGYESPRGEGYHALIDELQASIVTPWVAGRRVLEVGCGTGLILERLRSAGATAVGVDVSRGMAAKAHARGFPVALASATDLPFGDGSFDAVCAFKVLAHVTEIRRALAEIARVTRLGGTMVLDFYNAWSLRYLAKRIAGPGRISAARTEADVYTRWDSPLTIRTILPPEVELVETVGVRILTPVGALLRVPVLSRLLVEGERLAMRSPARHFGGFLVAVLRKVGSCSL